MYYYKIHLLHQFTGYVTRSQEWVQTLVPFDKQQEASTIDTFSLNEENYVTTLVEAIEFLGQSYENDTRTPSQYYFSTWNNKPSSRYNDVSGVPTDSIRVKSRSLWDRDSRTT